MKVSLISMRSMDSVEFLVWKIPHENLKWHLIGIYHPPVSGLNPSNNTSLDVILDCIGAISNKYELFLLVE